MSTDTPLHVGETPREMFSIEYHGNLKQFKGDLFRVLRKQIVSVNGRSMSTSPNATVSLGDNVIVRSSKTSRSGRACTWDGVVRGMIDFDGENNFLPSPRIDSSSSSSESPNPRKKRKQVQSESRSLTAKTQASSNAEIVYITDLPQQQPNHAIADQQIDNFAHDFLQDEMPLSPFIVPQPLPSSELLTINQGIVVNQVTESIKDFLRKELSAIHSRMDVLETIAFKPIMKPSVPALSSSAPLSMQYPSTPNSGSIQRQGSSCGMQSPLLSPPQFNLPIPPAPLDDYNSSGPPELSNDEVESVLSELYGQSSISNIGQSMEKKDSSTKTSMATQVDHAKRRVQKWVEDGYSEFLTPEAIISKLNITLPMKWDEWLRFGLQLAQSNIFGERELSLSSIGGRDFKLLDPVKLNFLKEQLRKYAPQSSGAQFEDKWSRIRDKIGNACKRHRLSLQKHNLQEKAEFLFSKLYTGK